MKHFLFLNIFLLLSVTCFAQEETAAVDQNSSEYIFTSKDKDYMQYWHYEQILKMDITEEGRDGFLSLLNYYTYKMSRLGLPKYGYTNAERKVKFDALVDRLNADMKDLLSPENYKIHEESFKKIIKIVYDKRGWE